MDDDVVLIRLNGDGTLRIAGLVPRRRGLTLWRLVPPEGGGGGGSGAARGGHGGGGGGGSGGSSDGLEEEALNTPRTPLHFSIEADASAVLDLDRLPWDERPPDSPMASPGRRSSVGTSKTALLVKSVAKMSAVKRAMMRSEQTAKTKREESLPPDVCMLHVPIAMDGRTKHVHVVISIRRAKVKPRLSARKPSALQPGVAAGSAAASAPGAAWLSNL